MVDEDRLLRLLDGIRTNVDHLAELARRPRAAIAGDIVTLSGVKYLFVVAIEGCAKVAHHIAASGGWPAAETNGDAVRDLGRRGVVSAEVAASIADAVGFRNLLVHQYGDIDDGRAVAHLDQLDDLRDFVAEVTLWVERDGWLERDGGSD